MQNAFLPQRNKLVLKVFRSKPASKQKKTWQYFAQESCKNWKESRHHQLRIRCWNKQIKHSCFVTFNHLELTKRLPDFLLSTPDSYQFSRDHRRSSHRLCLNFCRLFVEQNPRAEVSVCAYHVTWLYHMSRSHDKGARAFLSSAGIWGRVQGRTRDYRLYTLQSLVELWQDFNRDLSTNTQTGREN